nr:MAG TPA: holin [Caudoviricetes sp.]
MKSVYIGLVYTILGFFGMAYIAALLGILIGIAYKAFHWIV